MDAATALDGDGGRASGQGIVDSAYREFHEELERRLACLVRDDEAARDLAQEAFLRLHVEVEAGRAPRNVRAWLHRVAGNLVTSRGRHAQVEARHAPRLAGWELGLPTEEVALRRDRNGKVSVALSGMRPDERRVLLMAAAGLRGPEIAARIGRSELATRTLICRARFRLRAEVERLEATA